MKKKHILLFWGGLITVVLGYFLFGGFVGQGVVESRVGSALDYLKFRRADKNEVIKKIAEIHKISSLEDVSKSYSSEFTGLEVVEVHLKHNVPGQGGQYLSVVRLYFGKGSLTDFKIISINPLPFL